MALDDTQEAALRAELSAALAEQANTAAALKAANKEAQGHRLNADRASQAANDAKAALDAGKAEAAAAAESLKADLTAKATDAEARAAEAKVKADGRVIGAEMRAAAVVAGMRDPDLVKLLDASAVTLADDDKVVIPPALFDDAKKARPYLFGAPAATSGNTMPPPRPDPAAAPVKFGDMTPDQQAQWKREQGLRP